MDKAHLLAEAIDTLTTYFEGHDDGQEHVSALETLKADLTADGKAVQGVVEAICKRTASVDFFTSLRNVKPKALEQWRNETAPAMKQFLEAAADNPKDQTVRLSIAALNKVMDPDHWAGRSYS